MATQNRKTFHLDNDKEKPVTAGGVILYRFIGKNMELLLMENRGVFEDLGGRADEKDKDIYSTVSREASEESNKLLIKRKIKKRLKSASFVYMIKSKYIVYIIRADEDESLLTSNDFGDKEIHDDIFRKIKWVPLDTFLLQEIIKHKLNFRLKSKTLFDKLKGLKNDEKLDSSVFSESSKNDSDSDEEKPKKKKKVSVKSK